MWSLSIAMQADNQQGESCTLNVCASPSVALLHDSAIETPGEVYIAGIKL